MYKAIIAACAFSMLIGAGGMRYWLNKEHARQLAANDRACLNSVFRAATKRKFVPVPKLVHQGRVAQ